MKSPSELDLSVNALKYKRSLDRIIDKYSKLQDQDDAKEVDLNSICLKTLEDYLNVAKASLDQMEAQRLADVSDESLRAHDCTRDSQQLDFSHHDGDPDDSSVSSSQIPVEEDEGMIRIDTSQLSQWSDSMVAFQPEDQDEDLELTLRGNTSLMELYPGMISRLERAYHRHSIFEAADSVLRRYRKWRQQPHKSLLNGTFDVTLIHRRPKSMAGVSGFVDVQPQLQSPLRAQQWSPGRGRSPQRRAHQWPALVMDFSDSSRTFNSTTCSLNETFNVLVQGEPSCSYSVSPSHLYPTPKKLSLPRTDRGDAHSPPARHSLFETRTLRSPQSFARSPRARSPHGAPREPLRSRATSASSSPRRPAAVQMLLFPRDSHLSQSRALSPSAAVPGRHRLGRHRSFDASLPSVHTSYSARDLDEDFIKLYHRIVCQSKSSFFSGLPCRYCARNPEANKNSSSSSLAALALSPHRSFLRKRVWEERLYSSPDSKRSKVESYASSPGSKRHSAEMLRRRLSPVVPAQPRETIFCSPSKRSLLPVLFTTAPLT